MINLTDIRSLTDFMRHSKECIGKIKQQGTPMVLTVNGKAELVVQDAKSYQALLEQIEHLSTIAAIRQGIDEANRGDTRPAGEFFAEMRAKYGISD